MFVAITSRQNIAGFDTMDFLINGESISQKTIKDFFKIKYPAWAHNFESIIDVKAFITQDGEIIVLHNNSYSILTGKEAEEFQAIMREDLEKVKLDLEKRVKDIELLQKKLFIKDPPSTKTTPPPEIKLPKT